MREVIAAYKNSVGSKPTTPLPLSHDLEEWSIRGNAAFTSDEQSIDKLLKLAPSPQHWASALRAMRDSGNWMRAKEYALDLFNNYRRNVKMPPYLWAQIALTLIGDNEENAYHAAQRSHEASINPRKTAYPLYLALEARMLERSAEYEKAFQFVDRALSIWSDEARWHAQAARLLEQAILDENSKYPEDEARQIILEHLDKACQIEPNNPSHYKLYGQSLLGWGDLNKSIEILNQGIELDERDPGMWIALAKAHESMDQTREASIMAKRTLDLDKDHIDAMLILARIALHQGNFQQALKQTNFVLERKPDNLDAMTMQAWAYSGLGNQTEAIHAIDAVLAVNADDIDLILERIRIVNQAQGAEIARASLEKLVPN
ncbi:MAG: tetratricopeptide repeat protein, partial [Gammaproteobacteria bacterium]|nr:tetratricopeptide repeat protein [candidate division Zixibacteria bacterium]NIR96410.1 tetratricopeptide repeat protein [Gammaproteobacteria bacterium]NIS46655.1 tetratricopeptide repeat protein [candidate division Zixibacteria bacterium]NIU14780.1 tetratricopeptide repeat protein [candidate division Zixibacteria bacterium]NIV08350.1 tetratricopeptide repeat protein [candidate division Zixibacteria bacterium]